MNTNTNSFDPPALGTPTNRATIIPPSITVTWLDDRNFRIHVDSKSVDFSQYNTNAATVSISGDHQEQFRPIADQLTGTDWGNLRALDALRAISRESAINRKAVVAHASNTNPDSHHNEISFAHLKELELIDSVKNVGSWITAKGLELIAENVRQ